LCQEKFLLAFGIELRETTLITSGGDGGLITGFGNFIRSSPVVSKRWNQLACDCRRVSFPT
jgi:hypothetical protein